MDGHTRQAMDDAPCPKRLWVMTTLSDDEIVRPNGPLPQGLEFHLSRCPSCRALADDLLAVAASLGSDCEQELPESLLGRAQRQTEAALKDGARMSGRVVVDDDGADLLDYSTPAWWRRWTVPLAAAAMVGVAIGLVSIMRAPGVAEPGLTPAGVAQTGDEQPKAGSTTTEQPKASLARDAIEPDGDPTAVPEAYRGDDCKGENCVEKAFVPRRGRRRPRDRSLDNQGEKGSTAPAPNDR